MVVGKLAASFVGSRVLIQLLTVGSKFGGVEMVLAGRAVGL
jgi:hypothetical protein